MGYANILDCHTRSSIELRRIKNAKTTASRQKKWEEVRLQRELEEKKKVEDALNRRRRERARLSNYIYSSTKVSDKASSSGSHLREEQYTNFNDPLNFDYGSKPKQINELYNHERTRTCQEETGKFQQKSAENHFLLDSCTSLPSIVENGSWENNLETRLTVLDRADSPTDSLEFALQERLENEAATSILIAELTDIKSRLDDCLSKPTADDDFLPTRSTASVCESSVEPCIGITKEGTNLNLQFLDKADNPQSLQLDWRPSGFHTKRSESVNSLLTGKVKGGTTARGKTVFSDTIQIENRFKSVTTNDGQKSNANIFARNESITHSSNKENATAACSGKRVTGKALGPGLNLRPNPKDSIIRYEKSIKNVFSDTRSEISVNNEDAVEYEDSHCETFSFKDEDMLHEFHARGNQDEMEKISLPDKKVIDLPTISENKPIQERSNSVTKPPRLPGLPPLHRIPCTVGAKTSQITKPKGVSSRFCDAEKSLLASIERLDVKLAIITHKISSTSRTSTHASSGHQSTRSAPVMGRKASSDVHSVKSSFLPLRTTPATQARGLSPVTRRRQNVGMTNIAREKTNQLTHSFLSSISEQPKKNKVPPIVATPSVAPSNAPPYVAPPSTSNGEEPGEQDGKIVVHQNAEFLFT